MIEREVGEMAKTKQEPEEKDMSHKGVPDIGGSNPDANEQAAGHKERPEDVAQRQRPEPPYLARQKDRRPGEDDTEVRQAQWQAARDHEEAEPAEPGPPAPMELPRPFQTPPTAMGVQIGSGLVVVGLETFPEGGVVAGPGTLVVTASPPGLWIKGAGDHQDQSGWLQVFASPQQKDDSEEGD